MGKGVKRLKLDELAYELKVSVNTLRNRIGEQDFPRRDRNCRYDGRAVCQWFVDHARGGRVRAECAKWLASHPEQAQPEIKQESSVVTQPCQAVGQPALPPMPQAAETPMPRGDDFAGCLEKFRNAVNLLASAFYEAAAQGDDAMAQMNMRLWGQSFDQLRKAEQSVFDIQKEQNSLVSREEVAAAWGGILSNLRSKLLMLPSKLAHELTNQPSAAKVKDILYAEITEALNAVAENPVG